MYLGAGRDVWSGLGVTVLVGNGVGARGTWAPTGGGEGRGAGHIVSPRAQLVKVHVTNAHAQTVITTRQNNIKKQASQTVESS